MAAKRIVIRVFMACILVIVAPSSQSVSAAWSSRSMMALRNPVRVATLVEEPIRKRSFSKSAIVALTDIFAEPTGKAGPQCMSRRGVHAVSYTHKQCPDQPGCVPKGNLALEVFSFA
jgi:hypothetical protein